MLPDPLWTASAHPLPPPAFDSTRVEIKSLDSVVSERVLIHKKSIFPTLMTLAGFCCVFVWLSYFFFCIENFYQPSRGLQSRKLPSNFN